MKYKIFIVSGKGKQSRQRHRAKNYPLDPQRAGDAISTPFFKTQKAGSQFFL
jgi:hypothetical protein